VIVALILPQISMALAMTMLLSEHFLDEKFGEEKIPHGENLNKRTNETKRLDEILLLQ